jgi:RHS repeat-associated protein
MFYKNKHKTYNSKARKITALILLVTCYSLHLIAQNEYPLIRTASSVTPDYTLPKNALKPDEPLTISFSKEPKDEEIFRAHFFEEPLVPMGGKYSSEENTALVFALASFSQRTNPEDFTALTSFLKTYPNSRWRGAIWADLGLIYRRTGYYSKALEAWQQAWTIMKDEKDKKVKALADRVVAEILDMYCWVGRQNETDSLLKEIDNRVIEGSVYERIMSVRAALYIMKSRPGVSFKCGPYALNKLYTMKDSTKAFSDKMMQERSTGKGFSLYELQQMANSIGLKYQMAFRTRGASVIDSAVVHWKLGHYSALIKNDHGHYECEDATAGTFYGQRFWLTGAALDSSASGYFLVPEGALPTGWRKVSNEEGNKVFGKGQVPPDPNPWPPCPNPPPPCTSCSCPTCQGMAQSSIGLASINLQISDEPFFYTVPKGPAVKFIPKYNQTESYQPVNFTYSNMGLQWTFGWLSYIQDDPNNTSADLFQYMIGGGQREITGFNPSTNSYAPELYTKDVIERTSGSCYIVHHPDGSKEVYGRSDGSTSAGRRIFLTQIIDIAGNSMTISYDANLRIVAIQDALGQVTTLKYDNADLYKITEITALGRSAKFTYDGTGRLESIKDMIGIKSSFQYDDNNFITGMTTPYGTTNYQKQDGPGNFRSLQINYPLGAKERAEFRENVIPGAESILPSGMNVVNNYMQFRNTFYWDKKAMLEDSGNYTKATIYHWLHGSASTDENGFACSILESMKKPLENRIWYNYQGQSNPILSNLGMSVKPSITGQVLSDGTTQLKQAAYNALDHDTLSIDPSGRSTSYKYDSTGIDLLEVRQTTNGANELLTKNTYDPQHPHLIKTTTDASGQTTTYTYNGAGQIATITNARKEKTTFSYDGNGYLKTITDALPGATTSFTYDGFGRVRTVTDAEGYAITTDYDNLDRPTITTYPNGTFRQIVYDRLDAVAIKDRLNRWTHYLYDSLGRLNAVTDPLGRITQYIWCTCGNLTEIVDPLKHITTFDYDLEGRLISKTFDDGKGITNKYDSASNRLLQKTDAKGQTTKYSYYIDDNVKQIDYSNAVIATPPVYFAYDGKYNRLDTMIDGTGATIYSYYPVTTNPTLGAGKLKMVDGPLSNDNIVYSYDTLGRIKSRSINNVASTSVYDALGRVTSVTIALGTFKYSYVHTTNRIANITNPNGTTTAFTYFDNLGDLRLKEIWNKKSSTTFSKFDYEYNDEGQITKWTQKTNTAPKYYALGYDLTNELISATLKLESDNSIVKRYAYQYDKAGSRTSEQINNAVTSATYNTLNQEIAQQSGGPMRFEGSVDKFSSVLVSNATINDSTFATVDSASNNFEAFVKVKAGDNSISIKATDYSGNSNTQINNYVVKANAGTKNTLQFDDNGNTISETNRAVTYGWDAADRLVKITHGDSTTEFVYDGLGRRVAEKLNGSIIKRWVWCDNELCEERTKVGSTVTRRFFTQGEQINGTNYYFTKDHLGSVRELTDNAGNLASRYDYDPYGRRTKLSGSIDADFGFTGYYYHASSGLYLSLYRACDANLGRWLSRDPIESNSYTYVNNNSINFVDRLGLSFLNPEKCYKEYTKELKELSDRAQDCLNRCKQKNCFDRNLCKAACYANASRDFADASWDFVKCLSPF